MAKKKAKSKENKIKEAEDFYDKGFEYAQKSDADGAIECWEKTVELDPKHFIGWYDLGNAYYLGKEDIAKAFECWEKALELKPDDIDLIYNMGNAYREMGEYDKAIGCYKKIVEIEPEDHEAWNNMANTYHFKGDEDQAIECWKKAVKIKPDKFELLRKYGLDLGFRAVLAGPLVRSSYHASELIN